LKKKQTTNNKYKYNINTKIANEKKPEKNKEKNQQKERKQKSHTTKNKTKHRGHTVEPEKLLENTNKTKKKPTTKQRRCKKTQLK